MDQERKNLIRENKKQFVSFVRFKRLREEKRKIELCGNNFLYLNKDLDKNINNSGIEQLGTSLMLKNMGEGNFKFSRRWAWLFRHYIWASRVSVPRANLVEIGCDVGEIRKLISKSFYIKNPLYLGIDLDYKSLRQGAEQIQMKIPAIYVQHDVTLGLNFIKPNSIDIVFSGELIEHFEKKFGYVLLREIKRILKPGGIFLISTPNIKHTKNYDFHVYEYTIPEMKKMIKKIGLVIDKISGWTTTERCIKQSKDKEVIEIYNFLKEKINKDIIVSLIAYLDPDISEAFYVEGRKPL